MTATRSDVAPTTAGTPAGAAFALTAGIVGLCFTAISIYWGVGGTALLDTVGGSLERGGRAGDVGVVLLLWAAVVLKLIAAVLPLVVIYRRPAGRWQRLVRGAAWICGVVLFTYGLALTAVGLLVQLGVVAASATADHRALAWHAFLWDPWFLLWGILVLGSLFAARARAANGNRPCGDVLDQRQKSTVVGGRFVSMATGQWPSRPGGFDD